MCQLTLALAATSEAVGFSAVTEPVNVGAQLPHVPHPPRHHHLLLDDVRLRKVRPSLWQRDTNESLDWSVCGRNAANRKVGTHRPSLSDSHLSLTMLLQPVALTANAPRVSPWRWRAAPTGCVAASLRSCSARWCSICSRRCRDKLWGPGMQEEIMLCADKIQETLSRNTHEHRNLPSESRGWYQRDRCHQNAARVRWSARSCLQGRCRHFPRVLAAPSEERTPSPRR